MDSNIFRKFSENLKKILLLAERISKDSGRQMDSEDLLLALTLTKGTLANDLLINFEITSEKVSVVAKLVANSKSVSKSLGVTSDTKQILQSSIQISAGFGHFLVDAEHLLLALISDKKYHSYSIIERIGVEPEKIKEQLETIFSEISKATNGPIDIFNPPIDGLGSENLIGDELFDGGFDDLHGKTKTLEAEKTLIEQYTTNISTLAKENKLDPLIGRDNEIERVTQILSRRTKNNPLLIGEPGVGKTAIIEGLAKNIIDGNVPQTLIGKTILSLDLGSLLAGTMYRGQFESRIKKLLAEIKKLGNVILFIDEIHTTIGTGSAEGSLDTANMLKPILTKSEFKVIGATTFEEYKKHIERDPAYERRFQIVRITEPSEEETYKILKGLKLKYEEYHQIKFTDDALHSAAELAKRYISDRYLPDKAIDLIDEAAAATNKISPLSFKLTKLKTKLFDVASKKEEAVSTENYEAATNLRRDEIKLTDEITAIEKDFSDNKAKTIDKADIEKIVSRWTGVDVENLSTDARKKYLGIESKLKKFVVGQDPAISVIAKSIRRSNAGVSDPKRPISSYLFLGPTGVGKTHLAKKLAELLFGSEENLIKIDMSEFMEKHNVSRLVGAPAGYVGYDDGGKLTEAVRHKPYSIILFDEIEKAHPEVFNILLQILEDGKLTDAKGRQVNFRNTIIILTSNLGTSDMNKVAAIGFNSRDGNQNFDDLKSKVMDVVKKEMRPEFINRLDNIVVFRPLDKKSVEKIVEINLLELAKRLKKQKINFSASNEVKKYLAEIGFSQEFGARPIRRAITDKLEDPISEAIISEKYSAGSEIKAHLIDKKIVLQK